MWTLSLSFFSWRAIIDHLMTHDKTTFRDLMSKLYKSLEKFGCGLRPLSRLGFHNWHLLDSVFYPFQYQAEIFWYPAQCLS